MTLEFLSHFFAKDKARTQRNEFIFHHKLTGHGGAVLCMSPTDDGSLLASGGTDGVRIWNLRTNRALSSPVGAGSRGATTALKWVCRTDDPEDALFYGTQRGQLVCWKQKGQEFEERYIMRLPAASEITGIAYDGTAQLAVCNMTGAVQLYRVDATMRLNSIFSIVLEAVVPKALAFAHQGIEKKVLVFSMWDGSVYGVSPDATVQNLMTGVGQIGDAATDSEEGVFCVDDAAQGVGLYRSDGVRLKTMTIDSSKAWRPRQVCFAENGKSVVSGSDHGAVYVFERKKGELIDKLHIGSSEWLQTVTVSDLSFCCNKG
ncbi:WD40-repeat-containing domain protein [Lentinula edodes]|nr:WD40-repeat-containing domain protein [Lentinula edodes]